jgi:hypothetical protein
MEEWNKRTANWNQGEKRFVLNRINTTKTPGEIEKEFSAKGKPKGRPQSVPLDEYKKYDLAPGRNITVRVPDIGDALDQVRRERPLYIPSRLYGIKLYIKPKKKRLEVLVPNVRVYELMQNLVSRPSSLTVFLIVKESGRLREIPVPQQAMVEELVTRNGGSKPDVLVDEN